MPMNVIEESDLLSLKEDDAVLTESGVLLPNGKVIDSPNLVNVIKDIKKMLDKPIYRKCIEEFADFMFELDPDDDNNSYRFTERIRNLSDDEQDVLLYTNIKDGYTVMHICMMIDDDEDDD